MTNPQGSIRAAAQSGAFAKIRSNDLWFLIFKTGDPFAPGGVPAAEDGGWSDKKHYPFKLSKNISRSLPSF